MAKKQHLDIIKQGVNTWNKWRGNNPLEKPDLSNINLCLVNLSYVNFSRVNLWEANLNKGRLWDANFSGADLCFADLGGTDLRKANLEGANLTSADLSGANLVQANLRNTKLWGTNLGRAFLNKADLSGADFSEANLSHANLSHVMCHETNFSSAKLMNTKLTRAYFSHGDFSDTDLSESLMEWTTFANADLSTVRGLETIVHCGPSTVGTDTLYRSKGKIPDIFLRRTGMPDNLISLTESLADYPKRFCSCFITYAPEDEIFAEKLKADFHNNGIGCWMECKEENRGKRIQTSKFGVPNTVLLLIISKNSAKNKWMEKEVESAFDHELRRQNILLLPISLDSAISDIRQSWAEAIRRVCDLRDFSQYRNREAYQAAFNRLLKNIREHLPSERQKQQSQPATIHAISTRGSESIHFPEAIYKVIGENNCPLSYKLGDELILSEKSITFPHNKATCFILIEDILEVHTKYESTGRSSGYAFKCSACTGSIRLKYREVISEDVFEKSGGDTGAIVNLLSTFQMFQALDDRDIKHLISRLKFKKFDKGELIIRKGEPGRNLYIIVSGRIEVVGEGGISIAVMGRGEVFGEMSLLSGNPVGATIKVMEPVSVLYLDANNFKSLLGKFPSLQMYFTRLLARRLAEIQDMRTEEFSSGMLGKLSEMPPSELFQTFNINQKTGVLTFKLPKGNAVMAFRDGNLIRAEYGGARDQKAFYKVMKEKEGSFKFSPGLPQEDSDAEEIGDFMWLLMEGTKQLDEKTA